LPKSPRLNVSLTEEQHALLLELAELNGGSAASYLRQMVDQVTPLLRVTVPALRMAAEEMNTTKAEAGAQLQAMLAAISNVGVEVPPDLFDEADRAAGASGSEKPQPRSARKRPQSGVQQRRK
jgi:hypothetical protein